MQKVASNPSQREFVALMAMLFATVALSIDAMLPALPAIAADLSPEAPNSAQLVVTSFVFGMGLGTLVAGPISDAFGRKNVLLACAAIYLVGAALCVVAPSLELLLAARVIQGFGAAGPRSAGMALIRDLYKGRAMAQLVSFIMMIFTLVPAVAPLMGQGILLVGTWRTIFVAFMVFALAVNLWFALRQPETLPPAARRPVQVGLLWQATRELARHRIALISILCQSLTSACLFATLSSQQGIFEQRFDRAASFPLWFAVIALCAMSGSFVNSRVVMRAGMRAVLVWTYGAQVALTAGVLTLNLSGVMPEALAFPAHMIWSIGVFAMMGLTLGNLNALAMEDLGHIAGFAASVIAAASTVLSVALAVPVGLAFDGTTIPLLAGSTVFAALALGLMQFARKPGVA
jgi:MFS transporter, DHA1 family, multidrug resistance protein